MKYFVIATLLLGLVSQSLQQGQLCANPQNVVDDAGYQAAKMCSTIPALTIQHPTLQEASFPYLTSVGGLLIIQSSFALKSASFPLLNSVSQDIQFINNTALETIDIPTTCSVGGSFLVSYNGALKSVVAAVSTTKSLDFHDNAGSSWNITMDQLTSVNGYFNLAINNGLVGASFAKLSQVTGTFAVSGNSAMTSFSAPTEATYGSTATIDNQPNLNNLAFNPTTVGELNIGANGLTSSGSWNAILDKLTTATSVDVKGNKNLAQFSMAKLSNVQKSFAFSDNPSVTSLNIPGPFPVGADVTLATNGGNNWDCVFGASAITGTLSFSQNLGMNKLSLNKLVSVGTVLTILGNTVKQIEAINPFTIGQSMTFQENNGLTSVNLNGLRKVVASISIINNGGSGDSFPLMLNGLSSVSGSFDLNTNKGVSSLELTNLMVVGSDFVANSGNGGSFSIFDNDKLSTVVANSTGFTVEKDVTITRNGGMTVLNLNGLARVGGTVGISENKVNQILANGLKCATGVLLSVNNGLTDVQMKSLASVQTSVMYNPLSNPGCNMCVGEGSGDCAACGSCVSCNGNTDCGDGANTAWTDSCTATPAATCPVVVDNSTVPTEAPTDNSNTGTGSATSSDSSSETASNTNGSNTNSNTDTNSATENGSSSQSTMTEVIPNESEEGFAVKTTASVALIVLLAVLSM